MNDASPFRMASTDALTGLLNRRTFEAMVLDALEARTGHPLIVVAMIDIDNLRHINNEYGNRAGDGVIKNVALTIQREADAAETVVARVGGDEFAIMCQPDSLEEGLALVRRLLRAVGTCEFVREDRPHRITASAGVSSTLSAHTLDDLMRNADIACREAKDSDRDLTLLYQPEMFGSSYQDKLVLRSLFSAYGSKRFKIDVSEAEALSRGASAIGLHIQAVPYDERGVAFDRRLAPLIASRFLLNPIADQWLVEEATTRLRRAEPPFSGGRRVHLELSVQTFLDQSAMDSIVGSIKTAALEPGQCVIQLREESTGPRMDRVIDAAGSLARAGCDLRPPLR